MLTSNSRGFVYHLSCFASSALCILCILSRALLAAVSALVMATMAKYIAVGIAMSISSPMMPSEPFCSAWSTRHGPGKALTTNEPGMAGQLCDMSQNPRATMITIATMAMIVDNIISGFLPGSAGANSEALLFSLYYLPAHSEHKPLSRMGVFLPHFLQVKSH